MYTPKIMLIPDYIEEIERLTKENQKLKKQLEEKQNPLKGIFAQVTDDQLLRENGLLYAENKKYKEVIDKAIDLIEKSGTTDIGIDSNNNIIHYHQLTEDETGELLDILKEVK